MHDCLTSLELARRCFIEIANYAKIQIASCTCAIAFISIIVNILPIVVFSIPLRLSKVLANLENLINRVKGDFHALLMAHLIQ